MTNKDLVIAKLQKMNDEKEAMILQLVDEAETLSSLVGEVKTTLKDFKRRNSGKQIADLFNRLEAIEGVDSYKAKSDIMKYVIGQRQHRGGLHRVVTKFLARNNKVIDRKFELEAYPEYTFQAVVENAGKDANMALSVLASMLVVLLDIEETRIHKIEE